MQCKIYVNSWQHVVSLNSDFLNFLEYTHTHTHTHTLIHNCLNPWTRNSWIGKADCIEYFSIGVSTYTIMSSANNVNLASVALCFKNKH